MAAMFRMPVRTAHVCCWLIPALAAEMNAPKQRAYRDRKRGGPPRTPKPCGTLAAYRRHQRHGEPVCDACRHAYNEAHRGYYAKRKATR